MQNSIGKIRNIFITCCILHNIINMFNEAIADPLYEIDPDVDEDLFMDWDESLYPTWNDYKKTWMTVDPQGNIVIRNLKNTLHSELLPHPEIVALKDDDGINLQGFLDLDATNLSSSLQTLTIQSSTECTCESSNETCSFCVSFCQFTTTQTPLTQSQSYSFEPSQKDKELISKSSSSLITLIQSASNIPTIHSLSG